MKYEDSIVYKRVKYLNKFIVYSYFMVFIGIVIAKGYNDSCESLGTFFSGCGFLRLEINSLLIMLIWSVIPCGITLVLIRFFNYIIGYIFHAISSKQ